MNPVCLFSCSDGHLGYIHMFVIRNRYCIIMNSYSFCLACILFFFPSDNNTLLFQWKSTIFSMLLYIVKVGSTHFPLSLQGYDSSQVNQSILPLYSGKLGQGWMLEPCQNNVNSRTSVELEEQWSSLILSMIVKLEGAARDYYMRIGRHLSENEMNSESKAVSKRDGQIYHIMWGPRRVLVLDLNDLRWDYCWTSQSCDQEIFPPPTFSLKWAWTLSFEKDV